MDVLLAGFKSRLVQLDLEIGVMRISIVGLQVIVDGGVKILQVFRVHPGFVVLVALWAACKEHSESNADRNLTPATHGFSGTPSGPKSRLYLPLQSSTRLSNAASYPQLGLSHVTLSHVPLSSRLVDLRTRGWGPFPPVGPLLPAFLACLDAASGKMKDRGQANEETRKGQRYQRLPRPDRRPEPRRFLPLSYP